MGNLLEVAVCTVGSVYLVMHIAYVLLSVTGAIRNSGPRTREVAPERPRRVPARNIATQHHDALGIESRALP